MTNPTWPGTSIEKSMNNAFTEHLRHTRSSFAGQPGFRPPKASEKSADSVLAERWGSPYSKPGVVE